MESGQCGRAHGTEKAPRHKNSPVWPETLGSWASLEVSACVVSLVGGCVHVCVRRVYHRTACVHVGAHAHVCVCAGACDGDVWGVTCACVTLLCVRVPRACASVCVLVRVCAQVGVPPHLLCSPAHTCARVGPSSKLRRSSTCALCTLCRVPAGMYEGPRCGHWWAARLDFASLPPCAGPSPAARRPSPSRAALSRAPHDPV